MLCLTPLTYFRGLLSAVPAEAGLPQQVPAMSLRPHSIKSETR